MLTFDADIACLEIRLKVVRARLGGGEKSVWDSNGASSTRWTSRVDEVDDVRRASHVTVVMAHAPAQPHPAVARMRHQDGRAELAARIESFRLAVDAAVLRRTCTNTYHVRHAHDTRYSYIRTSFFSRLEKIHSHYVRIIFATYISKSKCTSTWTIGLQCESEKVAATNFLQYFILG